ncbi:MAG: CHAD domain-containing protein [Aurantimonas endophytica]|uniref:CHAD domain-containing protein n=1 Tax=Aurantimonas endophytica TaxID=1522175 RepID=A0A7W6MQ14_9HYPH|nr:CHAD domain-containing protein [Aurantimonas endophytica]MBB4003469.1 CHAD domain-containing protein [Aurantimonas endophytica]MCO6404329.1 CHAD domain-containing protein [Aurantimonas endophytica]
MAYQFDPAAPLDAEFRRIAGEQMRKAERELADEKGDRHEAVHDVRKRLKKLRGLIRLVRDARPKFYAEENARFRDMARALSGVRDRAALVESLDALQAHYQDEMAIEAFEPIRQHLIAQRDAAAGADLAPAIEATLRSLAEARSRLDAFAVGKKNKAGNAAAIVASGFARIAGQARDEIRQARKTGDAAVFHDLRKRAKYHSMHLRLLGPLWPEAMAPLEEAAKGLGEDLGLDHDYAVLRAEMEAAPEAFGSRDGQAVVLTLMERRQAELRQASLDAAQRLFAEDASAAEQRISRLWHVAEERAKRDEAAAAADGAAANAA